MNQIKEIEEKLYPEYYGKGFIITPESILRKFLEDLTKQNLTIDESIKEEFDRYYHRNVFVSFTKEEILEAIENMITFYTFYEEKEKVFELYALREYLK